MTLPVSGMSDDGALRVDIAFENWQMSLLAKAQNVPGVDIREFTTDGCSGGLSNGWSYLAEVVPQFARRFGQSPPWEPCCVEHDRAYWRGSTENGYEKRLLADQALRMCVIQTGEKHGKGVARHFQIAAELMYNAVRLGGKPCSLLPWRWGYGWPNCLSVARQE